jgi:FkbM family methyltransferase
VTSPFSIAYGQNAEDVVLRRALRDVDEGFYIEVGANDPTELSISRAFYDAGWHGIAIEPVESLAAEFSRQRPRDLVVHAAVTSVDSGTVTLHQIADTGLSTLDGAVSSRHEESGYEAREVAVPARTLDGILSAAEVPDDIHFMVVDTEGTEAAVLASIDLTRWRPWILVVEATKPLSNTPTHQAWEGDLLAAGYEFCLFDGISRFYVAAEHAERLRPRLSHPANVLDGFTPYHWHRREQEFAATRAELDQLRRTHGQVLEDLIRWRGAALARWAEAAVTGGNGGGQPGHEVIRLREELSATHATVSWRVTAPLRAVQGRLRGTR